MACIGFKFAYSILRCRYAILHVLCCVPAAMPPPSPGEVCGLAWQLSIASRPQTYYSSERTSEQSQIAPSMCANLRAMFTTSTSRCASPSYLRVSPTRVHELCGSGIVVDLNTGMGYDGGMDAIKCRES